MIVLYIYLRNDLKSKQHGEKKGGIPLCKKIINKECMKNNLNIYKENNLILI